MSLDDLVASTRQRLDDGYYDKRPDQPVKPAGSLVASLNFHDPAVVAEIKPARPSGQNWNVDVTEQAQAYAEGIAAGMSVLTDPDHFDGELETLTVAANTGIPALMKDFVIDPAQIEAARAFGASAVLVIARLPREGYTELSVEDAVDDAHEAGLEALVEVVTEAELEEAIEAGADAIGVNTRDLDTLEEDLDRPGRLLGDREIDVPTLWLSSVSEPEHVERALDAGADGVLVGTACMDADDPAEFVAQLRRGWF